MKWAETEYAVDEPSPPSDYGIRAFSRLGELGSIAHSRTLARSPS